MVVVIDRVRGAWSVVTSNQADQGDLQLPSAPCQVWIPCSGDPVDDSRHLPTDPEVDLSPLLEAAIGRDHRCQPTTRFGRQPGRSDQLLEGGFQGRILPVNPRYDEVEGIECFDSLAGPDPSTWRCWRCPNDQLEQSMQEAIDNRARSVAIFASCFGEASDGQPLTAPGWPTLARQAGIPVCGGNGMGFVNLDRQLRVTGFYQPSELIAGGVTFLTHSGLAVLGDAPQPTEHSLQPGGLHGQRVDHPHGRLHRLFARLGDHHGHRTVPRDGPRHARHVERAVGGRRHPGRAGGRPEGREDGPIAEGGHHSFGGAGR